MNLAVALPKAENFSNLLVGVRPIIGIVDWRDSSM
jgi:hypothetical protein